MRILWFTNTPSNYLDGTNTHNGGGWISSLENILKKREDIDLGIAFLLNGQPKKVQCENVYYYPIQNPYNASLKGKIRRLITPSKNQQEHLISEYIRVIEDFKPDIINIFGTEQNFGLLSEYTKIPILIHIQGLLGPYLTAFFPPGYNLKDFVWYDYNLWSACNRWFFYKSFKKKAEREKFILSSNNHFMGRTAWDQKLVTLYNPFATYDYCSEMLRDNFYLPFERILPKKLIITTTISRALYKGFDVVLKCAKLMKQQMNMDFEWKVFGDINPVLYERKENVKSSDVNVFLMGVANQDQLIQSICNSTLYVHPSYIDNSPNSVCEAQMMGCTVVAQHVGGMSSLINNGETGLLVPANDPYQMSCAIRDLYNNPILNEVMGQKSAETAHLRHNRNQIESDLMTTYQKYIQ